MSSRRKPVTQAIRRERRVRAEGMKADYDKLSLDEKIARLPKDGAQKQRARLMRQLEGKSAPAPVAPVQPVIEQVVETKEQPKKKNKKESAK